MADSRIFVAALETPATAQGSHPPSFGTAPKVVATPSAGLSGVALPRLPPAVGLGASLYLPATRPDLLEVMAGRRLTGLRSLIVCTEDSILETEVRPALDNLERALHETAPSSTYRFLRVRGPQLLRLVANFAGFGHFDGLVLPKVCLATLPAYAQALEQVPGMPIMPVLETELVFEIAKLSRLLDELERLPNPTIAIRIGGNDILQRLGMRRPRRLTAYETPLREAIVNILATARPRGFAVAAPVFEHFADLETLQREVAMDVAYGLTTKSAIHPCQVEVIEAAYRPNAQEVGEARRIAAPGASAVFGSNGSMCEKATHERWAAELLERAAVYGVADSALGNVESWPEIV